METNDKGFFPIQQEHKCQCEFAQNETMIHCKRHGVMKTRHLHSLCKHDKSYFNAWENGVGPNQSLTPRHRIEDPAFQEEMKMSSKTLENEEQKFEEDNKGFFLGDPEIPNESRGLGDTVAKITKVTGIKKIVKGAFGAMDKDCGCSERQSKLNKLFPYKNSSKPKKTKGFFE